MFDIGMYDVRKSKACINVDVSLERMLSSLQIGSFAKSELQKNKIIIYKYCMSRKCPDFFFIDVI